MYPAFYRVDSSNFDPQSVWNYGVQCVALNTQTSDRIMDFARAKFNDNGACGYVLKPDWMFQTSRIQRVGKYLPFRVYTRTLRLDIQGLKLQLEKKVRPSTIFSKSEVFLSIDMIGKKFGKYRKTISFVKDGDETAFWIPRGHVVMISESSDDKSLPSSNIRRHGSNNNTIVFPLAAEGCGMELLCFRLFVGSRCVSEYSIAVQNVRLGVRAVPLCPIAMSGRDTSTLLCKFNTTRLPGNKCTVKWPATQESELKAKEILRLTDSATLGVYRDFSKSDSLSPPFSATDLDNSSTLDEIPFMESI